MRILRLQHLSDILRSERKDISMCNLGYFWQIEQSDTKNISFSIDFGYFCWPRREIARLNDYYIINLIILIFLHNLESKY
jgi:hypothetical protein